jgi:hypothetical protein
LGASRGRRAKKIFAGYGIGSAENDSVDSQRLNLAARPGDAARERRNRPFKPPFCGSRHCDDDATVYSALTAGETAANKDEEYGAVHERISVDFSALYDRSLSIIFK